MSVPKQRFGAAPALLSAALSILLAPVGQAAPAASEAPSPEAFRVIEKRVKDVFLRLTLRPGVQAEGQVSTLTLELERASDIPDPALGGRVPLDHADPVVTWRPAQGGAATGQRFRAHHLDAPGLYGVHLTPAKDGVYTLVVSGAERAEGGQVHGFEIPVRIGVGAQSAETEVGEGSGRRGARRSLSSSSADDAFEKLMTEVGRRFVALESGTQGSGRPSPALVAEATALRGLLDGLKTSPAPSWIGSSDGWQAFAASAAESGAAVAVAAQGKDVSAVRGALQTLEATSCLRCHAQYRWGVATQASTWDFRPAPAPAPTSGARPRK